MLRTKSQKARSYQQSAMGCRAEVFILSLTFTCLIKKSKDKSEALSAKSEDAVGTRRRRVSTASERKAPGKNHRNQMTRSKPVPRGG